jgi:hypothetical protein
MIPYSERESITFHSFGLSRAFVSISDDPPRSLRFFVIPYPTATSKREARGSEDRGMSGEVAQVAKARPNVPEIV